MDRSEVYKLIDTERAYQNDLDPSRTAGNPHSVGAYLTMMRAYMVKADAAWTDTAGDKAALDIVRKITAIGIRCMEEHDTPPRLPWNFRESK